MSWLSARLFDKNYVTQGVLHCHYNLKKILCIFLLSFKYTSIGESDNLKVFVACY